MSLFLPSNSLHSFIYRAKISTVLKSHVEHLILSNTKTSLTTTLGLQPFKTPSNHTHVQIPDLFLETEKTPN